MIWLLFFPMTLPAAPCETGQFRYIEKQKPKTISIELCQEGQKLMSRQCLQKKCSLRKREIEKDKLVSQGTPHARRCHRVGGLPVIGDLKRKKGKWQYSKTLCFDAPMKIFVDALTLQELEPKEFGF